MSGTDQSSGQPDAPRRLRVWDLPTRVFHWLLVILIVGAWLTAEEGEMEWHAWIGQTILALVIYRVIWGLIGSQTAQFRHFIKGPASVFGYAGALLRGRDAASIGHNPLGALMIVALLALVAAQAALGLFANDDIYTEGPLYHLVDKETSDLLTGWHHRLFNVILAAAGVHIAAAVFYLVVKRENLIGAMITGHKKWPAPHPRLRFTPAWVAVPALIAAAAGVWAAVTYL